MRPINCTGDKTDAFSEGVCQRIAENQIGELPLFVDGMSVGDLQQSYASFQPYINHSQWTTGCCLHSDWIWGYFTNFYYLSRHTDDQRWKDVPQARIDGYNESEIYAGPNEPYHAGILRNCNNEYDNCNSFSPLCHYQTPENMTRLMSEIHSNLAK
jgi:hypothetical protein